MNEVLKKKKRYKPTPSLMHNLKPSYEVIWANCYRFVGQTHSLCSLVLLR